MKNKEIRKGKLTKKYRNDPFAGESMVGFWVMALLFLAYIGLICLVKDTGFMVFWVTLAGVLGAFGVYSLCVRFVDLG